MTIVISRLYANDGAARSVLNRLKMKGIPDYALDLVSASTPDALSKMTRAGVADKTAAAYVDKFKSGGTAIVARTTYKPLGAARITRDVFAETETVGMGNLREEMEVKDPLDTSPSVLKGHPRFLTVYNPHQVSERGTMSSKMGFRLLSARKERNSVQKDGGRRMSRMFWPMPLVSKKNRNANSAMKDGGRRMSRAFWPQALLSDKKRGKSVIEGGGHPLSRALGWPTIS
jgi:hypothetical protein